MVKCRGVAVVLAFVCFTSVLVSDFVNFSILEYRNLIDLSGTPKKVRMSRDRNGR